MLTRRVHVSACGFLTWEKKKKHTLTYTHTFTHSHTHGLVPWSLLRYQSPSSVGSDSISTLPGSTVNHHSSLSGQRCICRRSSPPLTSTRTPTTQSPLSVPGINPSHWTLSITVEEGAENHMVEVLKGSRGQDNCKQQQRGGRVGLPFARGFGKHTRRHRHVYTFKYIPINEEMLPLVMTETGWWGSGFNTKWDITDVAI